MKVISQQAELAVQAIDADKQSATERLKVIASTIDEVRDLATAVASNVEKDAAVAAEELKAFRLKEHTDEETADEADRAALKIAAAATHPTGLLRNAVEAAAERILSTTEESAGIIEAAAKAAIDRISSAKEKATACVLEVVEFHME